MAITTTVFSLSDKAPIKLAAQATATSSSEQLVGRGSVLWINATKDITIKTGDTGMSAAAATDMRIPANANVYVQMHHRHDYIRVFNLDASTVDVYISQIPKS